MFLLYQSLEKKDNQNEENEDEEKEAEEEEEVFEEEDEEVSLAIMLTFSLDLSHLPVLHTSIFWRVFIS